MLPSILESKHIIATITKRTTPRSIGLLWVGLHLLFNIISFKLSVLHPHHKQQYFEKAGWEETWIKTSRDIICTKFDQTYAFMDVEIEAPASQHAEASLTPPSICIF